MTDKYILAISGSDILSGGSLYADLVTHITNHLYSFLAVTCLTVLAGDGFDVFTTNEAIFPRQLDSPKDVPFSRIEFGLLPDVKVADLAFEFVKSHIGTPVVPDPVLICKEKHDVGVSVLRDKLLKFLPHMTIITPNLVEAELLTQASVKTLDDIRTTVKRLHQSGAKNLVVENSGRLSKEKTIDVFCDGKNVTVFEIPVLENNNTGAGCALASNTTGQLVLGKSAKAAVEQSKEFVYQAIHHSDQHGVRQSYEGN